MNCRSAQQLISPYLDQQLTGAEMLAMQQHLTLCTACAAEHRQMCEVRRLLRSLSPVVPDSPLETRITQRVAGGSAAGRPFGASDFRLRGVPETLSRPQRGRRLAGALALSCMALLMLAAPFAPSTGDAAPTGRTAQSGVMEASLAQEEAGLSSPLLPHMGGATGSLHPLFSAAGDGQAAWSTSHASGGPLSQSGASVTLSGWSAAPLDDEAVGGYAAGDAALAGTDGH